MTDFSLMIGTKILLRKIPHQEIFEAQILGLSANEQFVKLQLSDGRIVWEEIEMLQLAENLKPNNQTL
jgi:hypothetical protein